MDGAGKVSKIGQDDTGRVRENPPISRSAYFASSRGSNRQPRLLGIDAAVQMAPPHTRGCTIASGEDWQLWYGGPAHAGVARRPAIQTLTNGVPAHAGFLVSLTGIPLGSVLVAPQRRRRE